jgi:hypothetical protein
MAQEIFHYFGTDKYGTIGNDTTIASADMDGIMMICLQALEKRTKELNDAIIELKTEKERSVRLESSFNDVKKELIQIKNGFQLLTADKYEKENSKITLNGENKGQ